MQNLEPYLIDNEQGMLRYEISDEALEDSGICRRFCGFYDRQLYWPGHLPSVSRVSSAT